MPQLDAATYLPQIFWLAVMFCVLYLIVSRAALPRIAEVLDARQQRIDADLSRAEAHRKEAEATLQAYEQAMAETRRKAHASTVEAVQAVAAESAQRNDDLTARLAEETAKAEARIAEASAKAVADMQAVAAELVRQASSKLAGVEPSDAAIEAALADARDRRAV